MLDGTTEKLSAAIYDASDKKVLGLPYWAYELVEMPATKQLLAVGPHFFSGDETSVIFIDPATGKTDPAKGITITNKTSGSSPETIRWPSKLPAFKPAVAGDKLWFITPGPTVGRTAVLTCADNDAATNKDIKQWSLAFDPLVGPVFEPKSGAIYLPTTDGRIMRFVPGSGSCAGLDSDLAKLGLKAAVTGLTDKPSTPLVLGKDGALYFGTTGGTLAKLEPTTDVVSTAATVKSSVSSETSRVVGFVHEVDTDVWMGVARDQDAQSKDTKRRLFKADLKANKVSDVDVSGVVAADAPYPGVVRYR